MSVRSVFRFDPSLPSGAFTRDAAGLVFHCPECAPKEQLRLALGERFTLVAFFPPVLFDKKTGELVELFTPEEWDRTLREADRLSRRR